MSGDFDFEPVRGIPGPLPEGERLLWQGAPSWRSVATHVFHVRAVAIYFAVCLAWRIGDGAYGGRAAGEIVVGCLPMAGLAILALGFLTLMAWLIGRTTVYSITSRRVFMRFGVALPITLYLPFKVIGSAALKEYADGTGSVPLSLTDGNKFAYLVMWPHARPWRYKRAEPTLRFVPDARRAAEILGRAVASTQTGATPVILTALSQPASADASAAAWPGAPAAA